MLEVAGERGRRRRLLPRRASSGGARPPARGRAAGVWARWDLADQFADWRHLEMSKSAGDPVAIAGLPPGTIRPRARGAAADARVRHTRVPELEFVSQYIHSLPIHAHAFLFLRMQGPERGRGAGLAEAKASSQRARSTHAQGPSTLPRGSTPKRPLGPARACAGV